MEERVAAVVADGDNAGQSLEALFESEPELMSIIFKAGGLTHRHLTLLSSVSRKWRRLMAQETILRVLCPFAKESVLACGNGMAKLLMGSEVKQPTPVEQLADHRVCAAAVGERQAVFLDMQGRAVHMSYYVKCSSARTRAIAFPISTKVTKVSASLRHTLLLTEAGRVLAVGYNSSGQCGVRTATYLHRPHVVEDLGPQHRIVDVAAGYRHSIVASDQGLVFGFGQCAAGELGIGKASKDAGERAMSCVVPITRNIGDRDRRAVAVSAGDSFSVVLAHDGAVLYTGTMIGGPPAVDWPTEVDARGLTGGVGERFVAASAGKQHVLLLTDAGRVFSFGAGDAGQLGHGDLEGRQRPERVAALEGKRIEQIAAGHIHSLVRTQNGVVWVFGSPLGSVSEGSIARPTIMCLHASAIAAGLYTSLIVV